MSDQLAKREETVPAERKKEGLRDGALDIVVCMLDPIGMFLTDIFRWFGYRFNSVGGVSSDVTSAEDFSDLMKSRNFWGRVGFFTLFCLFGFPVIQWIGGMNLIYFWLFMFFGVDLLVVNMILGNSPKQLPERT